MATASTWSLQWAAVLRPLVIGMGAGLIVALLLYVLGVSCVWLMRAIADRRTDVENRGGNDHAPAEGTGHPGVLPSNSGVPNGGVEMGESIKDIAEDFLYPLPGGE